MTLTDKQNKYILDLHKITRGNVSKGIYKGRHRGKGGKYLDRVCEVSIPRH